MRAFHSNFLCEIVSKQAFYYTFIMEVTFMRRPRTSSAEQYRLVMDCRQSGLSDSRWCEENGIQPSTFYNWVTRLRKRGCEIPPPASKDDFLPTPHQDVVRVDLVPDTPFVDVAPATSFSIPSSDSNSTLRLEIGGAKLEISNEVKPELLVSILRFLRGTSC